MAIGGGRGWERVGSGVVEVVAWDGGLGMGVGVGRRVRRLLVSGRYVIVEVECTDIVVMGVLGVRVRGGVGSRVWGFE